MKAVLLKRRSAAGNPRYLVPDRERGCPAIKFGKGSWIGKAKLLAPDGTTFWTHVDFIPNPYNKG